MPPPEGRAPGSFYRLSLEYLAHAYPDQERSWQEAKAREIVAEVHRLIGTAEPPPTPTAAEEDSSKHPRKGAYVQAGPLDLSDVNWRSATAGRRGGSVEVALANDLILVRNSADTNGPVLSFSKAEWRNFVEGIRSGDFDQSEPDTSPRSKPGGPDKLDLLDQWLTDDSRRELVLAVSAIQQGKR